MFASPILEQNFKVYWKEHQIIIKSQRIKRVGCIGEKSNVYRVLGANLKESDHSEELNIDSG
jgi:hypothetical protein